jgi:hypothetical protein
MGRRDFRITKQSLFGGSMRQFAWAILFSMSVCFSARAEDMKLQNLVEWCNGEDAVIADPMAAKLMCTAWVGGFLSAMIFADGSATLKGLQKTRGHLKSPIKDQGYLEVRE